MVFVWTLFLIMFTHISLAESNAANSNGSLVLNQYYYGNPSQLAQGCNCQDNQSNTFLNTTALFVEIYGIIIVILLGIGWFINHNDLQNIKKNVAEDLKKDFSDKAQTIIKEVMKTSYDSQLNKTKEAVIKLENYVIDLRRAIETKQPLPKYPEGDENSKSEDKNVFDEP